MLSAVVSGLFIVLGVVAGHALGLTPVGVPRPALFFVVTIATYVEGSSLHPERGGASTLARYAFDELWSFVAGWAILLDYLIVMAIGAVAMSHYLAASGELDGGARDRDRRRGRRLGALQTSTGCRRTARGVLRLWLLGSCCASDRP